MKSGDDLINEIDWICEKYYRVVYQYCFYFTNNRDEAEDLTQETFIKVIKSLSKFRKQANIKTWILSIAKNTAIDFYRRKKIIQFIPDILLDNTISSTGQPEKELQKKEEWEEIEDALIRLKPSYRNVLILRGVQELSISETAEILNCSETKVRVDFHRALKKLNKQLTNEERRLLVNGK
ncbi:RNA polymerase sigma factor [Bacillus kwashiorkori]|uniref:RNA polymerase sigma factor n=1 Tax=Bacillus kwashiorkori TaxID=1522318 RepID=UPI0007826B12|nr:RNA polymerase sigma factor [Bacillus kwashiorkori]